MTAPATEPDEVEKGYGAGALPPLGSASITEPYDDDDGE